MRWILALLAAATAACSTPHPTSAPARSTPGGAPSAPAANRDPKGPPDVAGYIARLENDRREGYLPTRRLVELLDLRPEARVADLGCGPGVVSVELARAVPRGFVFAVDVEPAQLDRLNARLTREGCNNVVPVLCTVDDARLPPGSVDCIVIVDTYHHFSDRVAYLKRLLPSLAPGGRVANIDFKDGELPEGPPASHKVPRATMESEFRAAGLRLVREEHEFRYHDYLVFEREKLAP